MKNTKSLFIQFGLFAFIFLPISTHSIWGQCTYAPILHTSGTQVVGCTNVTVTSNGILASGTLPPCFFGPYGVVIINTPSSYTFTFSSPVSEVKIAAQFLDNTLTGSEELSVDIDGAFYPLADPGLPACNQAPLELTPSGTLIAVFSNIDAAGQDIIVTEPMNSITVRGSLISGIPHGFFFSIAICCLPCETEAGEITADPLELCPSDPATVPPPTGTFLDSDDLLQYILFSDLADTLGSIIATSSSPEFAFDPATMSTGVTYYISAIAGNNLGGNVDPDDPCLDISNAIEVTWQPEPSVEFTASFTDVCVDGCYDIEIEFIGTPPFHLQAEVTDADNINVVTIDEIYPGNMATYTLCLPTDIPIGNITIEATNLSDDNCECD